MLVRVKLIGSGSPNDPYRVPFPTYTHIHGNITQGYAIIDIPEDVHQLDIDDLEHDKADTTTEGQIYKLCDQHLAILHKVLDNKYAKNPRGPFRLEQV